MFQSGRSILLAGSVMLCGTTPSPGEPTCRPILSVESARLSAVKDQQRKWLAVLRADASRCATPVGRVTIDFIRLKENAPDLPFTEPFTWADGRTELAVPLWADEAVLDYAIGAIAPCACRD
jgi:hypothetical protein